MIKTTRKHNWRIHKSLNKSKSRTVGVSVGLQNTVTGSGGGGGGRIRGRSPISFIFRQKPLGFPSLYYSLFNSLAFSLYSLTTCKRAS
ncbi:hypothetical protein K1719_003597 [Acacia pycnantha]|nr:hypothetical protein K1719_003597 [Acacia pycnantha]